MQEGNCYIYCIRRPDTRAVKIGRAWDAHDRLAKLQTGSDVELVLEFAFIGHEAIEEWLHGVLAPWHIRGEWFRSSPEIEDWIERQRKRRPIRQRVATRDIDGSGYCDRCGRLCGGPLTTGTSEELIVLKDGTIICAECHYDLLRDEETAE